MIWSFIGKALLIEVYSFLKAEQDGVRGHEWTALGTQCHVSHCSFAVSNLFWASMKMGEKYWFWQKFWLVWLCSTIDAKHRHHVEYIPVSSRLSPHNCPHSKHSHKPQSRYSFPMSESVSSIFRWRHDLDFDFPSLQHWLTSLSSLVLPW